MLRAAPERSTTNSAPPHAPPCGREAPKGRIDIRKRVVARSVEEGIRVLETHFCEDLDFVANARMSHDDVPALQAPFREDDAKADYSKTAATQALVAYVSLHFTLNWYDVLKHGEGVSDFTCVDNSQGVLCFMRR